MCARGAENANSPPTVCAPGFTRGKCTDVCVCDLSARVFVAAIYLQDPPRVVAQNAQNTISGRILSDGKMNSLCVCSLHARQRERSTEQFTQHCTRNLLKHPENCSSSWHTRISKATQFSAHAKCSGSSVPVNYSENMLQLIDLKLCAQTPNENAIATSTSCVRTFSRRSAFGYVANMLRIIARLRSVVIHRVCTVPNSESKPRTLSHRKRTDGRTDGRGAT